MVGIKSETPEGLTYLKQLPAIFTCIGCGLIILTYLLFKDLRRLRYIQLVFYIAIGDLLAGILIAIGQMENESPECFIQGIFSNTGLLAANFWTCVVIYQVWIVVNRGSVLKDLTYFHLFCWGIPFLVSVIPLTTSTYSNVDDDPGWCFVVNSQNSPYWAEEFWAVLSFYVWIFFILLFNIVLVILIMIRLKGMQIVPETFRTTVKKLILYPFAIFVSWSVNMVIILYLLFTRTKPVGIRVAINAVASVLPVLQGFLFSIIFFVMNPLVRLHWKNLFSQITQNLSSMISGKNMKTVNENVDNDVISMRIEDELDFVAEADDRDRFFSRISFLPSFASIGGDRRSNSLFEVNKSSNTGNIQLISNTDGMRKKDEIIISMNNPINHN